MAISRNWLFPCPQRRNSIHFSVPYPFCSHLGSQHDALLIKYMPPTRFDRTGCPQTYIRHPTMFKSLVLAALLIFPAAFAAPSTDNLLEKRSGHQVTFINRCGGSVRPIIADTRCGYSPRCADASSYGGRQPNTLNQGQQDSVTIPSNWVGRIFAQNGGCGAKGEGCTLAEWNLDSGDFYTPQSYDISNIQGFTQSIQIGMGGCDTVTCTNVNCGCRSAYPPGDLSGCGNDSPVHACGAGDKTMTVVFCP